GFFGLERSYCACSGSRRVIRVDEHFYPSGGDPVACTAIVVDRDRREHHRYRRRSSGRARQRYCVEIRAEDVENALGKDEAGACRDVGGRCQDHRALAAVEIAERGTVEKNFVVQLRRQFGATPTGRPQLAPVRRTEGARDDLALHIALQKALLVVVEQLVAVKAIRQCGEAATRYASDDVDFIEQTNFVALRSDDLRAL